MKQQQLQKLEAKAAALNKKGGYENKMKCGNKCEVYSRVVGYHNPVQHWNKGKQEEFKFRVAFDEKISLSSSIPTKTAEVAPVLTNEGETISSPISNYMLFTFPHCDKCDTVKSYIKDKNMTGETVDLKDPDGYKSFQGYYRNIRDQLKRNDDNSVVLPIMLMLDDEQKIINIAQSIDEVKSIV